MRDYRNYIHPQKELSHGISLVQADAQMLWKITKGMILHTVFQIALAEHFAGLLPFSINSAMQSPPVG